MGPGSASTPLISGNAGSSGGRILCIASTYPRWEGDSTPDFVHRLATDLQEVGWTVDVLAPHSPGVARVDTIDGVHIERFRYAWPERRETLFYEGGALQNLRADRWNLLSVPTLLLSEIAAVIRRLRPGSYDVLHSHWILPQGLAGELSRVIAPIPHVVTVHGSDIFAMRGRAVEQVRRRVLGRADAVTVNSTATEEAVRGAAKCVARIERIPMGVDAQGLSPTQVALSSELRRLHLRRDGPLVVFVGRLVEQKGVADLLSAVGALSGRHPDIRAVILGEGPARGVLERQCSKLKIAESVDFVGWASSDLVPAYLAAADVFVGPTRTADDGAAEGQGLTILEAMAVGTPVVATRLGGIVDSVIDGVTGLLIDEQAPDQIAIAIERLILDPELARRLGHAGAAKVRQEFSRTATARRFSDLFGRLVGV